METVTEPTVVKGVEKKRKPKRQPRYNVVLLDDNEHTYHYVVTMLGAIFGYDITKSYLMACEVDSTGRVIVLTTTREHAELKQEQIHNHGADPLIPSCKGSMTAVLEPMAEDSY